MDCWQKMRILVPWVSAAVAILSLILLIVIGVTQIQPYDQAQHFKKTECETVLVSYNGTRTCDRSPGSFGSYNCIIVMIHLKDTDNNSKTILYDTEKELHEHECSYIPRICSVDGSENSQQVETFKKSLQNTFTCLRDLGDNSRVIRRREVTRIKALHMLLWPTFLLVLSIIIAIWGMVKTPRRTDIAYIEVPDNKRPRRSIYRQAKQDNQDDQETLTE